MTNLALLFFCILALSFWRSDLNFTAVDNGRYLFLLIFGQCLQKLLKYGAKGCIQHYSFFMSGFKTFFKLV